MRLVGLAEMALERACRRATERVAFGRPLADLGGNKAAQGEIAMIKVAAPIMALKIIDDAIQAFGAAGVSEDAGLARSYASIRTLRLADGPDEVHRRAIARLEYKKHR
jgi:alkylation response protein AidB-like acyl-CoA dehydrogenase